MPHARETGDHGPEDPARQPERRAWWRLWRRSQSGTALLEGALVLPVFALIVFGVVDLGRAYRTSEQLRQAARNGAAFAQYSPAATNSTCASDNQDITDQTLNADSSLGLTASSVTLLHNSAAFTSTCGEVFKAGDTVTVTVTQAFTPLTPLVTALVGSSITLTGTATVEVQQ